MTELRPTVLSKSSISRASSLWAEAQILGTQID